MELEYKGARWFKCDLHLHTPASRCFQNKEITAKQWVERAIEEGLDCVAVTDHNTNSFIDEIKKEAQNTSLTVFPGVEITCDTSKVHLLIIFDIDKTSQDINDFLVRADIGREKFGDQNAYTNKSVFQIAELAKADGALVIPAHIDEYNGINTLGYQNLLNFYDLENINAVQVVHQEFCDNNLIVQDNHDLKVAINSYYNNPTPEIEFSTLKEWFSVVKYAKEKNLAILTFSDNPHEPLNSKHGLWGIGKNYTWVKMDEKPCLEGLRQAFLLPNFRIKNCFESIEKPISFPELWIKKLIIEKTIITNEEVPFEIEFNPQLNTIIGGRGSGKSSILRFLRGVLNNLVDLETLEEILDDQKNFYKINSGRPAKGVLTNESKITIEIIRNNKLHKIIASGFSNGNIQNINILRIQEDGTWSEVHDEGYLDFFDIEHYSQKQIYEIAQEPNALRERIDSAIPEVSSLRNTRDHFRRLFLEKNASIRTIEGQLQIKGKIETQIKDLDSRIKIIQESGIATQILTEERFSIERKSLEKVYSDLTRKEESIRETISVFEENSDEELLFAEKYKEENNLILKNLKNNIEGLKEKLVAIQTDLAKIKSDFVNDLNDSVWKQDEIESKKAVSDLKVSLQDKGINEITNFENLNKEKEELNSTLQEISKNIVFVENERQERNNLLSQYIETNNKITQKRRVFLSEVVHSEKIKINIKPNRDKADFEEKLRKILQRENDTFQSDIDKLSTICFTGNVQDKLKEIQQLFMKIRNDEDVSNIVTGKFISLIKDVSEAQIDEIFLLIPEDEIEIQFKPNDQSQFRSLSTASAGQKTTAILTFILSYGNSPLILDQPEDDLDNRLVYGLVVDRLLEAKEHRQIIVVTHNANIPVNADAEYIISMNSESKDLAINYTGTVEQKEIKTEICDVMEGGNDAFLMRSKRYAM